jgi:hypothetical protein
LISTDARPHRAHDQVHRHAQQVKQGVEPGGVKVLPGRATDACDRPQVLGNDRPPFAAERRNVDPVTVVDEHGLRRGFVERVLERCVARHQVQRGRRGRLAVNRNLCHSYFSLPLFGSGPAGVLSGQKDGRPGRGYGYAASAAW